MRECFQDCEVSWACTVADYAADVTPDRFHIVPDVNRRGIHRTPWVIFSIFRVLAKERPTIVITTGAMPGLIALMLAKVFFGCSTIWVDSIANFETMSGSGRIAAYFADVYLTQWRHLSDSARPDYWGEVI